MGHGLARGLISKFQGGSFKSGFLSGLTSGFDVGTKLGGTGIGGIIERTGIMAIAGGTASVIGGGKFSNGAFGSAMTHLFNAEYDTLGKALKGLWSKKGEIISDAGKGIVGVAYGLHQIMTMDASKVPGGLIGEGLFGGLTLRIGAGNGSAIGYELSAVPLTTTRVLGYTNPVIVDSIYTVGSGDMFSLRNKGK